MFCVDRDFANYVVVVAKMLLKKNSGRDIIIREMWNMAILTGEIAVPCTCNPLQQGLIANRGQRLCRRVCRILLRDGSCAIRHREPCQVGNQAALSGQFGCDARVPVLRMKAR